MESDLILYLMQHCKYTYGMLLSHLMKQIFIETFDFINYLSM